MIDRTPKPGYRHPTVRAYEMGCRCLPCLQRRQRDRKHRELFGSGLVPAKDARDHLLSLMESGFTQQMISGVSGVPKATLNDITRGRPRMQEMNAKAILAVTPDLLRRKAEGARRMPLLGAQRRLHALSALGWTYRRIAESRTQYHLLLAISHGDHSHLTQSSYDQVVRLYEKYSGKPGPSEVSRSRARIKGWAPPLAWDDHDLDNPDAQPDYGNPLALVTQDARERFEEFSTQFRALIAAGRTGPEAAAEMGMTVRAAWKRFRRGAPDDPIRLELTKHIRDKKAS